jgi:membrane-bound lytic murein transglycosylase D
VKFFLKATVVVVLAFAVAGCTSYQQIVSSPDDVESRSGADTVGGPSVEETRTATQRAEVTPATPRYRPGVESNLREEPIGSESRNHSRKHKNAQQTLDEALEFLKTSQEFWGKGDFENGIAALDQAYELVLKAETNGDPKLVQQKEDIRFMICKRMLEIYASRHTVAKGNHNAIPMVMNTYVQREIKLFQGLERKFFLASYKRSGKYRPEIVKALEEAGLPTALSWLPLIESGFKVKALSRARALGLWQFIPSTGYKYGLKRDEWIDERMDVTKSTQGAIAYMKELHDMFGDWMTVLAAYNCGEARVLRVIRNQNVNYLDNFWDLFDKLPYETARYVPRYLASLHIIKNPKKYGFDLPKVDPPEVYERVTVAKRMRLKDVAKTTGISSANLQALNPELRYQVTPPRSYALKVPMDQGPLLVSSLDKIPEWTAPARTYTYHRVRRGETLSHIAARHGTSASAIARANNISTRSIIRVGQRLKVPTKHYKPTYTSSKGKKTAYKDKSGKTIHRVQRGDSLWLLARRYDTNIKEIMRLNNLKSTRLHIGQKLVISAGTEVVEAPADAKKYRVKRGDSPYTIAQKHKMSLQQFLRINDLTPRSRIYPGQVLLVTPRGGEVTERSGGDVAEGTVATATKQYRVKRGDSPDKIARKHKMSLERFLHINDLTRRSKIYPGQVLLVEVR